MKRALLLAATCLLALEAHAATFYVIVGGLGGEPDYEQRFTTAANNLDLTVTTYGGTSATSSADYFSYTNAPLPAVYALSLSSGYTTGGVLLRWAE